jgi:hypothetical protein
MGQIGGADQRETSLIGNRKGDPLVRPQEWSRVNANETAGSPFS